MYSHSCSSMKGVYLVYLHYSLRICFVFWLASVTFMHTVNSCLHNHFLGLLLLFYFDSFSRNYVWSTMVNAYLVKLIMHSWNINENKVATLYGLFQVCLILKLDWIKIFLDDFVCIITNHNHATITLTIHSTFFIIIFWWHNLGFIIRYIFHSPDFLRSFVISCKSGLVFSKHPFIDCLLSSSLLYSTIFKNICNFSWFIFDGWFIIWFWF